MTLPQVDDVLTLRGRHEVHQHIQLQQRGDDLRDQEGVGRVLQKHRLRVVPRATILTACRPLEWPQRQAHRGALLQDSSRMVDHRGGCGCRGSDALCQNLLHRVRVERILKQDGFDASGITAPCQILLGPGEPVLVMIETFELGHGRSSSGACVL